MSTVPSNLRELLEFINTKSTALTANPGLDELTDFSNGCSENFVATYGDGTDIIPTPALMRSLLHLAPILTMNDVVADIVSLERRHRVMSASEFSFAVIGHNAQNIAMRISPLEDLILSPSRHAHDPASVPSYSQQIPDEHRPFIVAATLKVNCIFSTIWGFFMAYEDPTMANMFHVVDQFARGRLPSNPSQHVPPNFSRVGLVLGWNAAMDSVERVCKDRLQENSQPLDHDACLSLMQSSIRAAVSFTATAFSRVVHPWTWSNGITFERLNVSFSRMFDRIVAEVAPQDEDEVQVGFSLQTDTTSVREVRPPVQQMQQPHDPSQPSRVLNVSNNVLAMMGLEPPNKRARVQVVAPPPPGPSTQPPPPPLQPMTAEQIARNQMVARERVEMEQRMRRREQNRVANRALNPRAIWNRNRFDIRALRDILDGRNNITYEHDNPDSENDELEHEQDLADAAKQSGNVEVRVSIEKFILFIVNQHVEPLYNPSHRADDSMVRDYGNFQNWFLHHYLQINRHVFAWEATRCLNPEQYADHLKAVLYMELVFQMQRALYERFPRMSRTHTTHSAREELLDSRNHRNRGYFTVRCDKVERSRGSIELITVPYSASHNVRMNLVREFPGHTVCIGVIVRGRGNGRNVSPMTLYVCRSVSHQDREEQTLDFFNDPQLDNVIIRLAASRYHLDDYRPVPGDVIRLIPVCSVVSTLRQLKALHEVPTIPDKMQQILFGTSFQEVERLPNKLPPKSRQELEASFEPLPDVRARVDPGCLAYIDSLPENRCDPSQRRALLTSLGEMGSMRPNSNSLSLINGPPGCGKSWTITMLSMALLHHSEVGHFLPNAVYPSTIPDPSQEFLRCSNNPNGLKILLTSPGNKAVDELARKLREFLPLSDGTLRRPHIVRVGRFDYDYEDLYDISLHHQAGLYDAVLNPQEEGAAPRRTPTRAAREALVREACIFLATNATAAGPYLLKLGVRVSAVIVDEAAHASEGESLMSIISNVRLAQQGRVHVTLVGDQMQLGPVFMCSHAAVSFLSSHRYIRFNGSMKRQFESLFERLYRTDRAKCTWLTYHYRSHPDLAANVLSFQYHDILTYPLPRVDFETPFTSIPGPNGIDLLTIIDTRCSKLRFEGHRDGSHDGPLFNKLEVNIVHDFLWRLYNNRGNFNLVDNIIVASPYAQQVRLLREELTRPNGFCSDHPNAPNLNVVIDTTDALQGSERSVAVISLTRSNRRRHIGFLRDERRLNVAFSRARHVTAIVGDFSTMDACEIAEYMYSSAVGNYPRTSLQFHEPPINQRDDYQDYERQRIIADNNV